MTSLRAVGALLEEADGALLDAIDVAARLALAKQHLTGGEGAISVGRNGAGVGGVYALIFKLDDLKA